MMSKIVDILLNPDVDQQLFIDSLPQDKVSVKNSMKSVANVLLLNVEEDYIDSLKQHPSVAHLSYDIPSATNASLPNYFEQTGDIRTGNPVGSFDGRNIMPMQFLLSTDLINPTSSVGVKDTNYNLNSTFYRNRYTGKHVDIVTIEAFQATLSTSIHDHPDFLHPDTGLSRIIPMDWADLEETVNQQVTNGGMLTPHSTGVLSAAAGRYSGFAKRANLRQINFTAYDSAPECVDALIYWHNNKAINPETGLKNPTILINEYQWLLDRRHGIPIEDILSITDTTSTVNRPVGGWGTDFTPFTSRNIIPFRVFDPNTSTWVWCCVFPSQSSEYITLRTSLEAAWDAGIISITPAGNGGGVYCKYTDPRYNGVYVTISTPNTVYNNVADVNYNNTVNVDVTYDQDWYPFKMFGPAGLDKSIDVAAIQNSQDVPLLDAYSNRGPGIDICGLGARTWSAYQSSPSNYLDSNNWIWNFFSGTSCAAPTVAGIAACICEEYYVKFNQYPTPDQVKTILLNDAKSVTIGLDGPEWDNVPSADTNYSVYSISNYDRMEYLHRIETGYTMNGMNRLTELAGTTQKRIFFNAQGFSRINSTGKRPTSAKVYPRPKIRKK